jgi:hypothetical protein
MAVSPRRPPQPWGGWLFFKRIDLLQPQRICGSGNGYRPTGNCGGPTEDYNAGFTPSIKVVAEY